MTAALIPLTAAGPLRRQWFPVAPSTSTRDAPIAVRLLGNDLVLWRSPNGAVVAAPDRCTHSKRALSKGTTDKGRLACPKHGWTFGDEGRCIFKPSGLPITDNAHLKTYPCTERYGLIWVSLGDPDTGVIDLPWDEDERYRRVHSQTSVWRSNPVQIVEALLAESVSQDAEVTADLPFVVHSVIRSDDAAVHRRLLSCAPIDSRSSLVTTVVWTTGAADADDAAIVSQANSGLDEVRSFAEEHSTGVVSPVNEATSGDEHCISSEWKRRLIDFGSRGN